MKKTLLLSCLLLLLSINIFAQDTSCANKKPIGNDDVIYEWCYDNVGTNWNTSDYKPYILNELQFRLLYPKDYYEASAANKKYPLIIFVHGIGEAGNDNNHQLAIGAKQHLKALEEGRYDGFIMFPQTSNDDTGIFMGFEVTTIFKFIEIAIRDFRVDPFRVQVEGLSAGGSTAWKMAREKPQTITSAVVMSSAEGGNTDTLKYTAIWHSQGGRDNNPTPSAGNGIRDRFTKAGANYRYYYYPNLGHGTWNATFDEPDFFPFLMNNSMLNIHAIGENNVAFKQNFCEWEEVKGTLGVKHGFEAYAWKKDGDSLTHSTNVLPFSGEEALGSYQVKIKRKGEWSQWSKPLVLKRVDRTPPPVITVNDPTALPTLDNRTTATLYAPKGYGTYEWYKDNVKINGANADTLLASAEGSYSVSVTELYGCASNLSNAIKITQNNNGVLPAPGSLTITTISERELALNWSDNSTNEAGFEIYRSRMPDGPWVLVKQLPANSKYFLDTQLNAYTRYFYSIRAVNSDGGSNYAEGTGKTKADVEAPSTPENLEVVKNSRTSISLQWLPSTDNAEEQANIYYEIYGSDKTTVLATTSQTAYTLKDLEEQKYYTLYVKAVDQLGNRSDFSNQVTASTYLQGLYYTYYEGKIPKVYAISDLTPIKTGIVPNFDIETHRQSSNYFYFKFEGHIIIPATGNYTFYLNSDDGSNLAINGKEVLNNANYNSGSSKEVQSAPITLTAGVHEITVLYYQWVNLRNLEVYWESSSIAKQRIPDTAFKDDFSQPKPPAAPGNLKATTVDHQSIKLDWADKSTNESGFEIYRSTSNAGPFNKIVTAGANVREYPDLNLDPATTYYYKIRSIGDTGESEFTGMDAATGTWENATTLSSGGSAALSPPLELSAARQGTAVLLNWQDKATGEDGYEIYRNGNLIATSAANSNSFLDDNAGSTTFYTYKVRAYNSSGQSEFSNEASVSGTNFAPQLAGIGNIHCSFGMSKSFRLVANDQNKDQLTFSTSPLPGFARLELGNNGTATLILDPTEEDFGIYENITISVKDSQNEVDSETISIVIGNNDSPGMMGVASVTLKEGETESVEVRAFDADRETVALTLVDAPEFVYLNDLGDNSASIAIKPGFGHAGEYLITVKATDPNGANGTSSFVVVVLDVVTSFEVKINLNDRIYVQADAPWNNFARSPNTGNRVDNLLDITGKKTPLDIIMLDNFSRGDQGASTGEISNPYPDAVLKTHFYGWDGNLRRMKLSDLDPALTYTITLLGSGKHPDFSSAPTEYIIGGISKTLATLNNTSNTITFENVEAQNGEIIIGVKATEANKRAYINALVVGAQYINSSLPEAPTTLTSIIDANSAIQLNWADNAANESGYEVWRGTDGTNFSISGATDTNINAYTDKKVTEAGTYYYKVRAFNANGHSAWSNVVELKVDDTGTNPDLNKAPKISKFPALVSGPEGTETRIEFDLSDPDGDELQLITRYMPSFATIEQIDSTKAQIVLNPSIADIGYYTGIQFTASDGTLETDVVFNISVSDSEKTSVYINLTYDYPILAQKPWNNTTIINPNSLISNIMEDLLDEHGVPTGFDLRSTKKWEQQSKVWGDISTDDAGIYPNPVTQTAYVTGKIRSDKPDYHISKLKLSDLNTNKRYNFVFFGSSVNKGVNGTTNYTIGNTTVSLLISNNIDKTVQINGVKANELGEVELSVSASADSENGGLLNALVIEEYEEGQLLRPGKLKAHAVSTTQIDLQWIDNSYQETGFEIQRRELPDGTFSAVTTGPNVTTYSDVNLKPNTGYEYKVRALGSPNSKFSETKQAATLLYKILVNVTNSSNGTQAPDPWYNLKKTPQLDRVETWYNLTDDNEQGTFVNLSTPEPFDGANNFGAKAEGDGIYPDQVIRSFYYNESDVSPKLRFFGLDPDYLYNFHLFGSSAFSNTEGVTVYKIGSKRRTLEVQQNINKKAVIRDVKPNSSGEIFIDISAHEWSNYGFLNGLVVEARDGHKEVKGASISARLPQEDSSLAEQEAQELNEITTVYPNPTQKDLSVVFNAKDAGKCSLVVMDVTGRIIHNQEVSAQEGINTFKLEINKSSIRPGIYILRIKSMDFESKVVRFMKQ